MAHVDAESKCVRERHILAGSRGGEAVVEVEVVEALLLLGRYVEVKLQEQKLINEVQVLKQSDRFKQQRVRLSA